MVLHEPDFFQENLDIARAVVIDHLGDIFDSNTVLSYLSTSIIVTDVGDDRVNELSEVVTDWQVDQNILE